MEALGNKDSLFGTKAVSGTEKQVVAKNALRLQPILFWVFTYVFAILVYQLISHSLPLFVSVINIVLFPFAAILLGKLADLLRTPVPFLSALLYPSYKTHLNSSHFIFKAVITVIKLFIYIVLWQYAFIFGTVGLILAVIDVKNLSK